MSSEETLKKDMKKILVCIFLGMLLINCEGRNKQQLSKKKYSEFKEPLLIGKDFSVEYLKVGELKYSEFQKINKTKFKKTESGSLACGNVTFWTSSIELENEKLKLSILFQSEWLENTEKKEEVLYSITLGKKGTGFYNGIIIGKSNINDVKTKFGNPKRELEGFLEYLYKNKYIQLYFDNNILKLISIKNQNSN